MQIAIDGPSGAGKSTIAKHLAENRGFIYLDTGAMYRAFGLYAIRHGVDFADFDEENGEEKLGDLMDGFHLSVEFRDGSQRVIVNGEDYTGYIRTPEVSLAASKVGVIPFVRLKMMELQREIAADHDVVMDGRDIGAYVLPNAEVKIFLTASVEERAKRRYKELLEKGEKVDFCDVLEDMKFRDYNDSHRKFNPLICAEDAVIVDTTFLDIDGVVAEIDKIVGEKR